MPSPVACHCGGMVDEAVLSLVHWSGVPVTPGPVTAVAGASSSAGGVLVAACLTGAECRGRADAMVRAC